VFIATENTTKEGKSKGKKGKIKKQGSGASCHGPVVRVQGSVFPVPQGWAIIILKIKMQNAKMMRLPRPVGLAMTF
jgi:hypothetical protein